MYYKVMKDGKVIDVLDSLTYVKYQEKHNIMVVCDESEAQAIVSSDGSYIWHVDYLFDVPANGYATVGLEKIDQYEYEQLRVLNMKTPEEIIDAYTLFLLEENML